MFLCELPWKQEINASALTSSSGKGKGSPGIKKQKRNGELNFCVINDEISNNKQDGCYLKDN